MQSTRAQRVPDVVDAPDRDRGISGRVLLALRELLLKGEIRAGERLAELALVERLGASRTPVRAALSRLEQEGFVDPLPNGGYVARAFSERDVAEAIEIRGTLEGLAARLCAERGVASERLRAIRACLAELDLVALKTDVTPDDFARYAELNGRFHALLIEAAESRALAAQMERAVALPFASPSGLVMTQAVLPQSRVFLQLAQEQHRSLVEAIEAHEGSRAEALAREHARLAVRNLAVALRGDTRLDLIPGGQLLDRATFTRAPARDTEDDRRR